MDVGELVDHLADDGARLAEAAGRAGLEAPVVHCPGWTVRDLVTHVGGVHRWATEIVAEGYDVSDTPASRVVGSGPPDAELLDWFRSGHAALVRTLREAPADLACFTFLPAPSPLAFWARRQAHETAIHRVDAETAAGASVAFDTEFAQDGIDEVLVGFARRPRRGLTRTATLSLQPTDGGAPWLVEVGPEGAVAQAGALGEAEAVVRGSSSDLYCWLWNRSAQVEVSGDPSAAELWRNVRVRWS